MKDILFDDYGDISIFGKDIVLIHKNSEAVKQNAVDRIRSARFDYKLYDTYGANLGAHIGKPVSTALEEIIQRDVEIALTSDGFLRKEDIKVVAIVKNNSIFMSISIALNEYVYSSTALKINASLNMITGAVNVY